MVKRYGPLDDPSVRTKSLVILSDVHCSCVCVITAHPVMSSAVLSVTTRDVCSMCNFITPVYRHATEVHATLAFLPGGGKGSSQIPLNL